MSDQIFVQHRFTIQQDGLTLQDAIVLPIEEYNALDTKQIDALKQERFDAYKDTILNPTPIIEKTPEEIISDLDSDLENQRQLTEAFTAQKINLKQKKGIELSVDEVTFAQDNKIDLIDVKPIAEDAILELIGGK